METKEWHIVQSSPLSNRIENETGFVIAVVQHSQADVDAGLTGKTNANAQLIAETLNLLQALEQLIPTAENWACACEINGEGPNNPAAVNVRQARQAINKATGKA